MNLPRKVLVIEDELDISRILKDYITISGYEVSVAENGQDGLKFIDTLSPDFIILDIMLPDVDGIELCRQIRETCNTPILILSARGSDTDKVLGLGFGADDYMTKPFSLSELVARINAHLRRGSMENKPKPDELLQFGRLVIDKKAYKVTVEGQEISLSAKEFELLYYLSKHKNQVFSKSQLLDAVWGYDTFGDESTITVYIRRLEKSWSRTLQNQCILKRSGVLATNSARIESGDGEYHVCKPLVKKVDYGRMFMPCHRDRLWSVHHMDRERRQCSDELRH